MKWLLVVVCCCVSIHGFSQRPNPVNKRYRNMSEGTYIIKKRDGRMMEEYVISNGNLDGDRKFYYRSGKLQAHEQFTDGHYDGWCVYLKENGDTITVDFYSMDTLLYVQTYEYHKNGTRSDYYWTQYERDSTLDVNPFHGFAIFNKRLLSNRRVDKYMHHHGEHTIYYEDGSLRGFSEFKNNQFEGDYILYHENGVVSTKTRCVNDEFDGLYEEFYEEGGVKISATYRNGELHGAYIEYDEYGKVEETSYYENGKKVKK